MRVRITVLVTALAVLWWAPSHAQSAPTEQVLPFKAKTTLTAGRRYSFAFSLWDSPVVGTGTKVWGDEVKRYRVPASKKVAHVLGSILPFGAGGPPVDFSRQLWVQVQAGKFVRRYKLTAAPYALWSATADTLGILCAPGDVLVVDATGEWNCGALQSVSLCSAGDLLSCYTGPPGTRGVGECAAGARPCESGAWGACDGEVLPTPDLCNGLDDDCQPASADGSEDPLNGTACDGADTDLCLEGTRSCSGGVLVCSDATGSSVDVCNGLDDDCDPASADGSEDPLNGTACDGPDTDLCLEGTRSCSGGVLVCSDTTGNTIEICGDGLDNDCDGEVDEDCPP